METSRILARIIGPILIVPAVGVFLNMEAYQHLVAEFVKNAPLCYLSGFMSLAFGLIMLEFHRKWEARWPVIITILGWMSVIKGIRLIIFPGMVLDQLYPYAMGSVPLAISLAVSLAVGVFLTIKGYRE